MTTKRAPRKPKQFMMFNPLMVVMLNYKKYPVFEMCPAINRVELTLKETKRLHAWLGKFIAWAEKKT